MSLPKMGAFTDDFTALPDVVSGQASLMKTRLNRRGDELKAALNSLVDALENKTDGSSGADNIGMTPIAETGAANNVQTVVEALIAKLKSTTDGSSGADLVGVTGISGLTGTTAQALLEALKGYVDAHLADEMPHQFTSTNKTYRYGFKAQDNHLIFTYEEVV